MLLQYCWQQQHEGAGRQGIDTGIESGSRTGGTLLGEFVPPMILGNAYRFANQRFVLAQGSVLVIESKSFDLLRCGGCSGDGRTFLGMGDVPGSSTDTSDELDSFDDIDRIATDDPVIDD